MNIEQRIEKAKENHIQYFRKELYGSIYHHFIFPENEPDYLALNYTCVPSIPGGHVRCESEEELIEFLDKLEQANYTPDWEKVQQVVDAIVYEGLDSAVRSYVEDGSWGELLNDSDGQYWTLEGTEFVDAETLTTVRTDCMTLFEPPCEAYKDVIEIDSLEYFLVLQQLVHRDRTYASIREVATLLDTYEFKVKEQYRGDLLDRFCWELVVEDAHDNKGLSYLGSILNLSPSGKFYLPFACSNVTVAEAALDELWREVLEEIAEEHGGWIESGEGDGCDLFFGISVDEEGDDDDE